MANVNELTMAALAIDDHEDGIQPPNIPLFDDIQPPNILLVGDPAENNRTFHPFTQLPPELRQIIWSLCLPKQRVLEYDLASYHELDYEVLNVRLDRSCRLTITASNAKKLPRITNVCRETRELVISNFCYTTPLHQLKRKLLAKPKHELILLAWSTTDHVIGYCGLEGPVQIMKPCVTPEYPTVTLCHTACSGDSGPSSQFEDEVDMIRAFNLPDTGSLANAGQEVLTAIAVVVIHVSNDTAARFGEGLFGRLGDAPIAVVDPVTEWVKIQHARRLWESVRHDDTKPWTFFEDTASDHAKLVSRARSNRAYWTMTWISAKYHREFSWDKVKTPAFPSPEELYDMNHFRMPGEKGYVKGHPWIEENRKRMPRVRPVVVFRHCPAACHMSQPDVEMEDA